MRGMNASEDMWPWDVGTDDNILGDLERMLELWFPEVQMNINSRHSFCNNVCLQELDLLLKYIQDGLRTDT